MAIIFSAGRPQLSNNDWALSPNTSITTTLPANTYRFSLQAKNRVGLTLPVYKDVTISANQAIQITLFNTALLAGEDWFEYIISFSTLGTPQSYYQIVAIPVKLNATEDISIEFPAQIIINKLADLEFEKIFPARNSITAENTFLNGKIIYIQSDDKLYEFNNVDNPSLNNFTFETPNGIYRQVSTSNTLITNVEDFRGCYLDIRADFTQLDYVKLPIYNLDGSESERLRFTITNSGDVALPRGTRINLRAFINNTESTALLLDAIFVTMVGFTNLTNGNLRIERYDDLNLIPELDETVIYNVTGSNLFLPDDLLPDEGLVLEIYLSISPVNYGNLFANNASVFFYPIVETSYSTYSPFYEIFTQGVIVDSGSRLALVPDNLGNIKVLDGESLFRGYSTRLNLIQDLYLPDEEEQILVQELSGIIRAYEPDVLLSSRTLKLATIEKKVGYSRASAPVTIDIPANSTITLDMDLGLDAQGKIALRNNLADVWQRGRKIDPFMYTCLLIVTAPDSTVYFSTIVINNVALQPLTINNLNNLDVFQDPINNTVEMGLINSPRPVNVTSLTTAGTLPPGNYTIQFTYQYTGSMVTDIRDTLPIFDLQRLLLGGSGGGLKFNKLSLISSSSITLDLSSNTVIDLLVVGNCNIEAPSEIQDGSTVTFIMKWNEMGGHQVTFDPYFRFGNEFSGFQTFAHIVNVVKAELYPDKAYCYLVNVDSNDVTFGGTGLFGNDLLVGNDSLIGNTGGMGNEDPIGNTPGGGQLNNTAQLNNGTQLTNG